MNPSFPRLRYSVPLSLFAFLTAAGCTQRLPESAAPSAATAAAKPSYPTLVAIPAAHPAPVGTPTDLDATERIASEKPSDPTAQRNMAFCYYRIGAYAQAAEAFDKASHLAPDAADLYLYAGWTRMALGSLPEAIDTFQKVAQSKNPTTLQISDAYLATGDCLWAMKQDDRAAEAFAKSRAADPKQGMASLGLGTYAASKGKRDQAKTFFTDAARDLPPGKEQAQAYACLGRLAADAKDNATAETLYRKALALDASNDWAKRSLARLTAPAKK